MKKILLLSLSLLSFLAYSQLYSSCKINLKQTSLEQLAQLGIAVDHGSHKKDHHFITDLSEFEMKMLKTNQIDFEILFPDVSKYYQERSKSKKIARNGSCGSTNSIEITVPENFNLGSMGGFYTYQEFLDEIDAMHTLYPDLITLKAPISDFQTHENRPIYWLKISDNASNDEAEPEILHSSIHHAREPMSLTSTVFYMWYLLENYATNPEIQYLVNETEMFFVPLLNPDGYIENETNNPNGGGMHRKNKRNNGDGTFGVDLNRNYNHAWGTTGISFNTSSDTYPGTGPFSEPETQAMKWFCENRDFTFAFNAHSYSNLILFPIGSETNAFADDHDYFQTIGNVMTQYNGFVAQKSSALYPASGDSDDYMYLEDLATKPKIFAFTPEIGSDADGFWPAEVDITGIAQGMVFSNLVLAHAPHNYWTVSENDPNSITELTGFFNHSVLRLGTSETDLNVSIEALSGIQSVGQAQTYDLALNVGASGQISYVLNPNINLGDEIKYVLISDFGNYTHRDTITKTYGNPSLQYENEGNDLTDWTGNWGVTGEDFVSPSTSFTDSPMADYANFTTKTHEFNEVINLTNATSAKIQFQAKWDIELAYDYARMEVQVNNSGTWIGQCGKYTSIGVGGNGGVQPEDEPIYDGVQSSWVLEEINLNDYLGQEIRVRFILRADGGVRGDGFYFDDFQVLYNEESTSNVIEKDFKFQLFPNPSSDKFTISTDNSMIHSKIRIVDQFGKIIQEEEVNYNTNEKTISSKSFAPGIYFVQFISKSGVLNTEKLIHY
jgi:carboxypeptidase T